MFFLKPTSTVLLAAAKRIMTEYGTNDTQCEEAKFASQAKAIAICEINDGGDVEQLTARDISVFYRENQQNIEQQPTLNLYPYWRRLAEDIRAGHFDTGPESDAVHRLLTTAVRRRIQMENQANFSISRS